MRLFGILLIVFNLLAGGGFLYLATQDWKGRQTITAAGLRHVLLLQGLPLEGPDFGAEDETPFVVEMGGGESTKTVSKKLLESHFQANAAAAAPAPPAGGAEPAPAAPRVNLAATNPVTSQVAEVKRVQGIIKGELAKEMPTATKVALLRGWLLYQAENYDTRLEYLALASPTDEAGQPKSAERLAADVQKLEASLDARFNAVLARPQVSDSPAVGPADAMPDKDRVAKSDEWRAGTPRDETERRMRLAHLLVHLDPDAAWQKRVMVVVGLRRYVKTVILQVQRFTDMIARVERYIPEDQAVYIKEETQLRERATQNSARAKAVAEERAKLVEQKTAADDAVSRWRTQLKELADQLTKVKGEVDELLVRQSGIEKQLYEIQREVALTLEDVYRLEALLAAVERERYGMPPAKP